MKREYERDARDGWGLTMEWEYGHGIWSESVDTYDRGDLKGMCRHRKAIAAVNTGTESEIREKKGEREISGVQRIALWYQPGTHAESTPLFHTPSQCRPSRPFPHLVSYYSCSHTKTHTTNKHRRRTPA